MSVGQFLFSLRGRINRAKYWLFNVGVLLALMVLLTAAFIVARPRTPAAFAVLLLPAALLYCPVLYMTAAVCVKRLHDRDKSGWWLLFFWLAPAVIDAVAGTLGHGLASLPLRFVLALANIFIAGWIFIELGFLRGTSGPNRYGPDPLEGGLGAFAGEPPRAPDPGTGDAAAAAPPRPWRYPSPRASGERTPRHFGKRGT